MSTKREQMKAAIERGKAKKPAPPPKKKPKPGRSAAARDKRVEQRGRLPDGASIVVQYHAGREMWSGALSVPNPGQGLGGSGLRFTGASPGVFRLLESLDDKYREHLKKGETK